MPCFGIADEVEASGKRVGAEGSGSFAQLRSFLVLGLMTSMNSASVESSLDGFETESDADLVSFTLSDVDF